MDEHQHRSVARHPVGDVVPVDGCELNVHEADESRGAEAVP